MGEPIRVLVVDDHAVVREGLRTFLELQEGIEVAGEAADGREALELFEADPSIDVVILDQRMPGMTGIETAREMLNLRPTAKIVLCSAYLDTDLRHEAESAGIQVSLAKREIDRLPQVMRDLAA